MPLTSPALTNDIYKFENIPGCLSRASDSNNPFFTLIYEPKKSKSNFWLQTILINEKYANLTQKVIKEVKNKKLKIRVGCKVGMFF